MKIYPNITHLIGKTPLIQINKLNQGVAQVVAKLESFNPLGSVKDRVALSMIKNAEKRGVLKKGSVIIEPTSGNTGVGLAAIGSLKGYQVILTMPETMSIERQKLLKALGAKVVLTLGNLGMAGAIKKAEELCKENPLAVILQQFENPDNPAIHKTTTAEEIWEDTQGKVDMVVAGIGTGGTITGVGETLKKYKKSVQIVGVEPFDSAVLSGKPAGTHKLQGIGAGFIPPILNTQILDKIMQVTHQNAGKIAQKLAKEEGILAGISSGAALWAGLELSKEPQNKDKLIVVILPDTGERYLSTWLFDQEF